MKSACDLSRRRWLLTALGQAMAAFLASPARSAGNVETARLRGRRRQWLDRVRTWGCQFQNLDIQKLASTDLDLVVVDHALGEPRHVVARSSDINRLKSKPDGRRRIVLAYLSVGEAENFRPYWKRTWKRQPPKWLGPANPNWPGAFVVRYWETGWKRIVFDGNASLLRHIVDAGFDGVFLDRVDAYGDWAGERSSAQGDMIRLVEDLSAHVRAQAPEFLIISQNAEPLLMRQRFRNVIDAVSKESLLYGLKAPEAKNSASDVAWSLRGLNAARNEGIPVLAIEYLASTSKISEARRRLGKLGFVPFFANRALDRLPLGGGPAEAQ